MLETFLHQFGYPALFIGTFFEGETILVLAAFLAHRGLLQLDLVLVCAFLGSYSGDQLWYYLGRSRGRRLLQRKAEWAALGDKALAHIRRHPDLWVLGFRFVYGMRTVMPVAIGLSGYPPLRYLLLSGVGAVIWALGLGLASYHFGTLMEQVLGDLKRYELWVFGGLALFGAALWLRRRLQARRKLS